MKADTSGNTPSADTSDAMSSVLTKPDDSDVTPVVANTGVVANSDATSVDTDITDSEVKSTDISKPESK